MTDKPRATAANDAISAARGRQILFYAPSGLLGGTFTCSRCGASGRHPDTMEHAHDCSYRPPTRAAGR